MSHELKCVIGLPVLFQSSEVRLFWIPLLCLMGKALPPPPPPPPTPPHTPLSYHEATSCFRQEKPMLVLFSPVWFSSPTCLPKQSPQHQVSLSPPLKYELFWNTPPFVPIPSSFFAFFQFLIALPPPPAVRMVGFLFLFTYFRITPHVSTFMNYAKIPK